MWNKIKPYMPWNVIEFSFYFLVFSVLSYTIYGPKEADQHATTMIVGAALFMAIQTRRKLDNGEYK